MRTLFAVLLGLFLAFQLPSTSNAAIVQLAQSSDEVNDPFADFSEFEESAEEEADINFFRNGRFFNIGMHIGQRLFTETMGDVFGPQNSYGFFVAYFFDLRFAMQFTYLSGQGTVRAKSLLGNTVSASSELSTTQVDFKYYLNTQNVTKGLGDLNPYILLGFSQATQTTSKSNDLNQGLDEASGINFGCGIEVPLLKNRMFIGGQITYQLINFKSEGSELEVQNDPTGIYLRGDLASLVGIIGVNF